MKKGLIVFDFDGTLVDTYKSWLKVIDDFCKEHGFNEEQQDLFINDYFRLRTTYLGIGESLEEQIDIYEDLLERSNDTHVYFPELFNGTVNSLEELKDEFDFAIVSSRDDEPLYTILEESELLPYFKEVIGQKTLLSRGFGEKPEPDSLFYLMEKYGFEPENTIMIGDTISDIEFGKNAECRTIAVTCGFHNVDKLISADPDVILGDISELKSYIDEEF